MTMQENTYGFAHADEVVMGGRRIPRLVLQPGDRARFWILSSGMDKWFDAARFHDDPAGSFRQFVCLDRMTRGAEECQYCKAGMKTTRTLWGTWLLVDYILHFADNPDADWEQIPIKDPQGGKQRFLFKEDVGRPLFLRMSVGKEKAWYNAFRSEWAEFGDLRKHYYELHRTGSGLNTEYALQRVSNRAIPERYAYALEDLAPVEDAFRDTLQGAPRLGTQSPSEDQKASPGRVERTAPPLPARRQQENRPLLLDEIESVFSTMDDVEDLP